MPSLEAMTALEREFHQEMISGSVTLRREHGYNPSYFLQMVNDHGGVGAVRHLLQGQDSQAGMTSLWEIERLDMSCGAAVLNPKYAALFTAQEKREARRRLAAVNYTPTYG